VESSPGSSLAVIIFVPDGWVDARNVTENVPNLVVLVVVIVWVSPKSI